MMAFSFALLCVVLLTTITAQESNGALKSGKELRILPLGDSITWGFGSSDGNGYRLSLLDALSSESHSRMKNQDQAQRTI